jgi:hypothetical protein
MLLPASIHDKPLQVLPRPGPAVRQRGAYSRIRIVINFASPRARCRGVSPWWVQRSLTMPRNKDLKRVIRNIDRDVRASDLSERGLR